MSVSENPPQSLSVFASRRRFIRLGVAAVGAAWAGALVQAWLFPPAATQEARPVRFPLGELPIGGTRRISLGGQPAVVLRTPETIRAFSLVCTHLNCTVEWLPASKEFRCPCHEGHFDQFGEVVSGPPPVPLPQYAVVQEGDQVVVGA